MILLVSIALGVFWIWTGFFALATADRILSANVPLPFEGRVVATILLIIGYPADILYNVVIGTLRFRRLPPDLVEGILHWKLRYLTYSHRIQVYINQRSGRLFVKALPWARVLNAGWKDHIDGVPK